MSDVLLVCPEPLAHGQPAGIGIRFVEMAKVLLADGHRVSILSRDGGGAPGCRSDVVSPEHLLRFSEEADVAVVQGHVANDLFAHAKPIPVVVDLYDPFIIENLHYYAERGAEVFTHDHATLVNSLKRGDLFLCASQAQRMFYLGLLLAVGRLNPVAFENDPDLDSLVRIAPFGVDAPRPLAPRHEPRVLFGGIYEWYDPILAIDAIAIARNEFPGVTITFTRHPNPAMTPQGKTAEAMQYVKKRDFGSFVHFEPWAPYGSRAAFFDRFAAALLTFPQSIETDLAMRTRVYDYLWGGLPIVTSSAPGTDEIMEKYDAGVVVEPKTGASAYAEALIRVLRERESFAQRTQAFVADHQWPRTLAPLRDFCRKPNVDRNKHEFTVEMHVPQRPPSIMARIKRRIGAAF